jgi:exodeoxyribonuclease-1
MTWKGKIMPQKTYLFYDLETTGTNKCFDQVLQFAAIRTDLELNELERHEIMIKLNPDVIPSPEAIVVHQISVIEMQQGEPELIAMEKIHALLNTPGTISCGYNTLKFDDEFLRFSFHKNLLPPYNHQWAYDCGRMDVYPVAMLYYLYKNDMIQWPEVEGKVSLKLEELNKLNHLAVGHAHTAIVDVEATVALAKLLFKDRKMWNYVMAYFDKTEDVTRMKTLAKVLQSGRDFHQIGLFVGGVGSTDFYQYPALSLGQHNHYKNQSLWLRLDKPELAQTTLDSVTETTWVAKKKAGDLGFLLPFSGRHIRHLNEERLKQCEENIAWLKANPSIFNEIKEYHREYKYPDVPNIDVDASLYQSGFLTSAEQQLSARFHQVTPSEKMSIARTFKNKNLREMAVRVIGRNYPDYLDEKGKKVFSKRVSDIYHQSAEQAPVDYKNGRQLTAPVALQKIEEMLCQENINIQQKELLMGLKDYLSSPPVLF